MSGGEKRYRKGTHRTVDPSATLARVAPLFPLAGITRVANVTGLDTIGIPVVMVARPNARSLSVSQGKGLTLDAARASGVMEALELHHAERVLLPLHLASLRELALRRRVVDVGGLPRHAAGRFDADRRLLWVEGDDLLGAGRALVPFELVHADYTLPLPEGSGAFLPSTNGLASGNERVEALAHALCELVERDAAALFALLPEAARRARRLDLATVDDPACRELLGRYRAADVAVAVDDLTSDVGVAAFACVVGERRPDALRPLSPASGMGCHPAREVALARALTEAAQSRLTLIAGSRDDLVAAPYAAADALARSHDFAGGARRFGDVPTRSAATVDEDLATLLDGLRGVGITEAIAVDLTREELGLPVVRVVVPGLEAPHDAPGYVPGRRARAHLVAAGAGGRTDGGAV